MQIHHRTTTCRKKKGLACRFNTPWAPLNKTRIVRSEKKIDETVARQSKQFIDKVLSHLVAISYLFDATLSKILEECGVTAE